MQHDSQAAHETPNSLSQFMSNANQVYHQAVHSMFALLESVCELSLIHI